MINGKSQPIYCEYVKVVHYFVRKRGQPPTAKGRKDYIIDRPLDTAGNLDVWTTVVYMLDTELQSYSTGGEATSHLI